MGKVAVSMRIMPESESEEINRLQEKIISAVKSEFTLGKSQIEEVAFGLKAIRLIVIMDDKEGLMDKAENSIKKISGVGEVEVEEVSLIS